MTLDDNLPEGLAATEQRIRAALAAEAGSLTDTDLRSQLRTGSTEYPRRRRQTMLLAAASTVIVLGGAVTILSVTSGRADRVAEPSTSSTAAIVTLSALPGNMMSCPYAGFKHYAQDAVQQGGAMVTGILRPTSAHPQSGNEQESAARYSPVQITITSILAGQLPAKEVSGLVEGWVDPPAPPSTQPLGSQPSPAATPTPALAYEGNAGWATDGAFLGVLYRQTDGTFIVNPTPLADERAVVGLGCWSADGLPTTRAQINLVLAGRPSVTISAPVELVTVQDIRSSLS